jgi:prepilin-type N-terminal cleavage/methylation domain-containing protein
MINDRKGFTLIEILMATMIMALAIGGTFQTITYLMQLNEANENVVLSSNALEGLMDEIRNVDFADVKTVYNGNQFSLNELTAKGVRHSGIVTVTDLEPDMLLRVKIVVSWEQRGRVIGEDRNLNGILEIGEDTNGNGELDSPCMIEAAIVDRML